MILHTFYGKTGVDQALYDGSAGQNWMKRLFYGG
jgi:hypothetical protein